MPSQKPDASNENQPPTLAATPTPIPQDTATLSANTATLTATSTPEVTITPTFSSPMVGVSERTNCRTGPGVNYQLVVAVNPGIQLEILGAYPPQYWLVRTEFGDCWLYGEFATPVGSFWTVPSITPPPTSTGQPPQAPYLNWDFFCNQVTGQADINLSWQDLNGGESGYRIYRDGSMVAELAQNSIQYSESIPLVSGQSVKYFLEVYDATATAQSSTVTITCP